MLYQILVSLFALVCFIMVLIILMQKGKSSMGLGGLGGGSQLLFGGSGGQDLFQKVTWALGTIFMVGSLVLAMVKRPSSSELLGGLTRAQQAPIVMPKQPVAPATEQATAEQPAATQPQAEKTEAQA